MSYKRQLPSEPHRRAYSNGFTIVELLIVIVLIAILAAITIVAYLNVQPRARAAEASAGVIQAKKKLELYKIENEKYPPSGNLDAAGVTDKNVTFQYTSDGLTYCITGTAGSSVAYKASESTDPSEGVCNGHTAPGGGTSLAMQTVTAANCPTSRTAAFDARDNRTYWVQKLADDKCWMLTNLAYAGGGTNTYSDTKALVNATSDSTTIYTVAKYYIPPGANPATNPTNPSTSATGTGQYGYFYNWCAAMGVQNSTSACANATTPAPDTNVSICPKNWRLPTGGPGGEFVALNNAVNSGSTYSDSGLLAAPWLGQRGGYWGGALGFTGQGGNGYYWSSSQYSASASYSLYFASNSVAPSNWTGKYTGYAVRCVAM